MAALDEFVVDEKTERLRPGLAIGSCEFYLHFGPEIVLVGSQISNGLSRIGVVKKEAGCG